MNEETAHYLINYFPQLMTTAEKLLWKHIIATDKLASVTRDEFRQHVQRWMEEHRLLVHDEAQLIDGVDTFYLTTARRIYQEHGGEQLLNNCPRCDRLARTPLARQCRHCGHNWH